MQPGSPSAVSKSLWTGRILSGLAALFLLLDGIMHMAKPAPVVKAFAELGYPLALAVTLGIVELVCVILYAIRRTAMVGAILLTAYLGGAIAVQLRVGNPLLSQALFPVYVALALWAGLYLRDERARAILSARPQLFTGESEFDFRQAR